jgi:hypothetical protein
MFAGPASYAPRVGQPTPAGKMPYFSKKVVLSIHVYLNKDARSERAEWKDRFTPPGCSHQTTGEALPQLTRFAQHLLKTMCQTFQ